MLIKVYHPFREITRSFKELLEAFSGFAENVVGLGIEEEYVGKGTSEIVKLLKREQGVAGFVSDYEAIYLETFYEYVPLVRFRIAKVDKIIIARKSSGFQRIGELKGKTVGIQSGKELQIVNPVISFFIKNCNIVEEHTQAFFPFSGYRLVDDLLDNVIDAAVVLDNVFHSLGDDQKQEVEEIGKFSCIPGFVFVMSAEIGEDMKRGFSGKEELIEELGKICTSYDFEFESSFDIDRSLIIEAIEGQGVNFRDYIENPESITWTISDSLNSWEVKELRERVYNLTKFNEKLVEMYKTVKQSRDELSSLINSPVEKVVLFSKDGKIHGVSRTFLKEFKYVRKDLMGKKIHSIFYSQDNIPIGTLIDKIDYGLIKSCKIRIKKGSNDYVDTKVNFSIVEFDDKKLILGVIT